MNATQGAVQVREGGGAGSVCVGRVSQVQALLLSACQQPASSLAMRVVLLCRRLRPAAPPSDSSRACCSPAWGWVAVGHAI